ncbi:MAG: HAD family hydrolase [Caldiserica bacterium]|nr:HAD family hydrolase [Caldisericota bacterium]
MAIKVVLFDMDGTIWDAPLDWGEARRRIGVPDDGRPIAHHLALLPPGERAEKEALLRRFEEEGVRRGRPIPGAAELLEFLRRRGIKCVLVTNNSRESAEAVLQATGLSFDAVFTREDGALKPEPEALLRPLERAGAKPEEAVLVGDSHHDLVAALRADVREVILVSPTDRARSFFPPGARFHEVRDLFEARTVLEGILGSAQ